MIVYRLRKQFVENGEEIVQFFATQSEGIEEYQKSIENGMRAKLEKMDCPTDKRGLAYALNLAGMHADHWLGSGTVRSKGF